MIARFWNLLNETFRKGKILPFYWLLSPSILFAQSPDSRPAAAAVSTASDTLYLDVSRDLGAQLVPFDDIYKIAVSKSPLIRLENEIITTQNVDYKLSKIAILQTATGFTNYSFGNQAILSNTSFGSDALGQIANGYRTGVGLQLSLYDLFSRGHKIRQARANYQTALIRKETVELQLKRDIFTLYQDLLTAQRILRVRLQDEQAAYAVYRIAEANSQQGRLDPTALASASNAFAQAKTISEQARGEFLKNIYYLELAVGVPLQELKRK